LEVAGDRTYAAATTAASKAERKTVEYIILKRVSIELKRMGKGMSMIVGSEISLEMWPVLYRQLLIFCC
jgi:ribosomal protein S11